jgi:hypothetical protein
MVGDGDVGIHRRVFRVNFLQERRRQLGNAAFFAAHRVPCLGEGKMGEITHKSGHSVINGNKIRAYLSDAQDAMGNQFRAGWKKIVAGLSAAFRKQRSGRGKTRRVTTPRTRLAAKRHFFGQFGENRVYKAKFP